MYKLPKKLTRTIEIVVYSMGAGLLIWVLANAFDRKPDPGLAAILAEHPEAPPPNQNLYFTLLGFDTAGEADTNAVGQRMFEAYAKASAQGQTPPKDLQQAVGAAAVPFAGDADELCALATQDPPYTCLAKAVKHRDDIGKMLQSNALLLKRYRGLWSAAQAQWYSTVDAAYDSPPWPPVFKVKRLLDSGIALEATSGRLADAVQDLALDAEFWRRLMAMAEVSTTEKILAKTALLSDFRLAAEIIRAQTLDAGERDNLKAMLRPLSAAERSLAAQFRGQLREAAQRLPAALQQEQDGAFDRMLTRHFFQQNATLNVIYGWYQEDLRLDAMPLPATGFAAETRAFLGRNTEGTGSYWNLFYNPVGHIMLIDPESEFNQVAMMIDSEGFRRLVALQLRIKTEGVQDGDIPAFLQRAGADYADPYTGAPMAWDPKARTLSFEAGYNSDRRYLPLPL